MAHPARASVHASAVLLGQHAVLIRGPAGSGKSRLLLALLQAAERGALTFARLVADDRTQLEAAHGRLLARPAPELAGLLEIRGLGIQRLPYEPIAVIGLVVDLAAAEAPRLPGPDARESRVEGVTLPRLAIAPAIDPLSLLLASLGKGILIA